MEHITYKMVNQFVLSLIMVIYQKILTHIRYILQLQLHGDSSLGTDQIRIASSKTNAELATPVFINTVASTMMNLYYKSCIR